MNRTFFAYHLTHYFGDFALDNYHTNSENASEGDTVYIISGDKDPEFPGVDYSLEGIFRIRRRYLGPFKLTSLKGELKEYMYRFQMESIRVPDKAIPLINASWYSRTEVHRYFSSGQNFNPLPTDPDYKSRFDSLLAEFGQAISGELFEDLSDIDHSVSDPTEREILSKARIGQGKFRADVMDLWGIREVCALTSIDIPELLTASHIKPWRDSSNTERLDPRNGILLATHADKLFDRYLMSFKPNGRDFFVELHPRVAKVANDLGIKSGGKLRSNYLNLSDTAKMSAYLEEHYRIFIQKVSERISLI